MNRQSKRTLWSLFAVMVIVGLLVSCTPAAPASPTAAPAGGKPAATAAPAVAPAAAATASAPAAPTTAPAAAPTAAPGGVKLAKEQVFRYPNVEPPSLDPGLATDSVSIEMILNIFEGLVEFDEAGQPVPRIAEKWSVSPDGLTWTFNIRQGPKWSNGDLITAKDFEYAWKRNLDPATASDYATTLYPIKGAEAFNTKKSADPNTVGVTAKDDRTLVVTLEEPAGYFLRLASTWTAFPLPRKAIEQHKDKWTEAANIVTNGPFKVESWKHDQEIVLVRNNEYWGAKPTLEKVQVKLFAETDQIQAQMLAAYENDELDDSQIAPADVERVKSDAKLGKERREFQISGSYFIVPNSGKKPLDDPRVRRALYLAIDPQKVIDIINIPAVPADTIVPPGIDGRKSAAYEKRPDIAKAKQLLAEAGYPDGQGVPEFTYTYNTSTGHKSIGEYMQQVWNKELGLKVKLENMEWNVFLKWRLENEYGVIRGGWNSDYEDSNNWFNLLLDSTTSPALFAPRWKNDAYDKLVRQARGESDIAKRKALYEQADEILAKEMPMISIFYNVNQRVVKPYVDGYRRDRTNHVILRDIKILDQK